MDREQPPPPTLEDSQLPPSEISPPFQLSRFGVQIQINQQQQAFRDGPIPPGLSPVPLPSRGFGQAAARLPSPRSSPHSPHIPEPSISAHNHEGYPYPWVTRGGFTAERHGLFQNLEGHDHRPVFGSPHAYTSSQRSPSLGNNPLLERNEIQSPQEFAREEESVLGDMLFGQCRIVLAVDISGSTAGRILSSEREFAVKVASQLAPATMAQNAKVVPWNHSVAQTIQIQNLLHLQSNGGTNPAVIIDSERHLTVLKSSNLWFLLTDGEIQSHKVHIFATKLAEKGMHGVPCIIIIFGNKSSTPSNCNISVGISPFAAAPHSALLYQDVTAGGRCHILATKGCFSAFLPEGAEQPILDDSTTWDSLPTIFPESAFRNLTIPPALELSPSELALSDDLTINFANLLDSDLDDNQVNQLLGNQDNLQSILLSAHTRGQGAPMLSWLHRQTAVPPPGPSFNPPNIGPVDPIAAESIRRITFALQNRQSIRNPEFSSLQRAIRETHRRSSQNRSSRVEIVNQAIESLQQASNSNWASTSLSAARQSPAMHLEPPFVNEESGSTDFCRGECTICYETDSVLAILFKRPHDYSSATPIRNSTLTFPLAAGAAPEYDIISAWIVCEDCSVYLVSQGETPFREVATSALPLTSWSRNSQRWRESLAQAIDYFDASSQPLLPILFLSILDHHLRTKAWCIADGSSENQQRQIALRWLRTTILRDVKMSGDGVKGTLGIWIMSIVTAPKDERGLIWKYPIDGFVLMVSIARELNADQELLTKTVWKKLLHYVTSRYIAELGQSDKARMGSKIDSAIPLMSGESWVEELQRGRFRPIAITEMEKFRRLKDEMMWVEAVAGPAMGRWLGFLKELRTGKTTIESIWEIKGRWGIEAETVMERPEDVIG